LKNTFLLAAFGVNAAAQRFGTIITGKLFPKAVIIVSYRLQRDRELWRDPVFGLFEAMRYDPGKG